MNFHELRGTNDACHWGNVAEKIEVQIGVHVALIAAVELK